MTLWFPISRASCLLQYILFTEWYMEVSSKSKCILQKDVDKTTTCRLILLFVLIHDWLLSCMAPRYLWGRHSHSYNYKEETRNVNVEGMSLHTIAFLPQATSGINTQSPGFSFSRQNRHWFATSPFWFYDLLDSSWLIEEWKMDSYLDPTLVQETSSPFPFTPYNRSPSAWVW